MDQYQTVTVRFQIVTAEFQLKWLNSKFITSLLHDMCSRSTCNNSKAAIPFHCKKTMPPFHPETILLHLNLSKYGWLFLIILLQHLNITIRSMYANTLFVFYEFGSIVNTYNSWQTIFPGNNGSVRH